MSSKRFSLITLGLLASGCAVAPPPVAPVAVVEPAPVTPAVVERTDRWPAVQSKVPIDAAMEARITQIISRMSLEEKVAQTIQPDISAVTPEDMRKYKFGSILAGGNSAPNGEDIKSTGADWLKLADAFWEAANSAQWAGEKIPPIFGIDAVHGHANVPGATIFPQNVGLGAMRDPDLIEKIGQVTAKEMTVTGLEWDFSPTIAVARDDRWGRSYESFSENPEVVRTYAPRMIEGLQGRAGTPEFMGPGRVVGTVKHFVGDGGTAGGKDQGDNPSTPEQLRDIHGAGYPPAIEAGVQSVMASFSSVRGEKVHGDRDLLTGALKEDMGFNGFVVGDWNAHGQVPGCSNTDCPQSINAGLDMYMAPDSWKGLYENTLREVQSGVIPQARLDDAVRRILRVKLRAGLFEKPKPSARAFGGQFQLLGAPEHRAIAREAVRKSLVLLKNSNQLLPLRPSANILVAGDGADNIAKQSGGWTITWQGQGLKNSDFRNAQTIYSGISDAVKAAGGKATLSADGKYSRKPDVAIVVFGEDPYAEFVGDRPRSLEFSPADKKDLELLRRLRKAGIPVVSVFLSGRPLWVNPEINASDAFVAAFLPGSEGGGVADLLFRKADGSVNYDFNGKLSFSWPKRADQTPLNVGDPGYDPLFAYGYGLRYGQPGELAQLSEERPAGGGLPEGVLFGRGATAEGSTFGFVGDDGQVRGIDRRAQEDSRAFTWPGNRSAAVAIRSAQTLDLSREFTGQLSLVVDYRVDKKPTAPVTLTMQSGPARGVSVPITGLLRSAPPGQWQTMTVPLGCFSPKSGSQFDPAKLTTPLLIETAGQLGLAISDVRVISATVPQTQCGAQ
jgi:beta-glucosidase